MVELSTAAVGVCFNKRSKDLVQRARFELFQDLCRHKNKNRTRRGSKKLIPKSKKIAAFSLGLAVSNTQKFVYLCICVISGVLHSLLFDTLQHEILKCEIR